MSSESASIRYLAFEGSKLICEESEVSKRFSRAASCRSRCDRDGRLHRLSTVLWLTFFSISLFLTFRGSFADPIPLIKTLFSDYRWAKLSGPGNHVLDDHVFFSIRTYLWFRANRSWIMPGILRCLTHWELKIRVIIVDVDWNRIGRLPKWRSNMTDWWRLFFFLYLHYVGILHLIRIWRSLVRGCWCLKFLEIFFLRFSDLDFVSWNRTGWPFRNVTNKG